MLLLNSLKKVIQVGSRKQLFNTSIAEPCQVIIHIRYASRIDSQVGRLKGNQKNEGGEDNHSKSSWSTGRKDGRIQELSRGEMLSMETDWSSVFDAAKPYNRNVIPLPIRMGRPRHSRLGDVPTIDKGNIELLKVPNFFHLTPPAIEKHCMALKDYCSPWPKKVGVRPFRVTTINYSYAGPSIRHPDSRMVKMQISLKDLDLDKHARRKFILLVGDRYNSYSDEVTLIADKCPTRKQNKEHAYYLFAALFHESKKNESWEQEAIGMREEEINKEVNKVRTDLYPKYYEEKKRNQRHYRVIAEKLVRYNRYGHPFVVEVKRFRVNSLNKGELQMAKDEWRKIKVDVGLPDTTSFDLPYKSSYSSEFCTA